LFHRCGGRGLGNRRRGGFGLGRFLFLAAGAQAYGKQGGDKQGIAHGDFLPDVD
jgi:hypothetical protein